MRPDNWPARLNDYIGEARRKAFAWGSHDCVSFTCGWHTQLTGVHTYAPFAGKYASEDEAVRLMVANDVHGMEEAGRYLFGDGKTGNSFVQRGDIVYGAGALGICIGARGAFLTEDGMTFLRSDKFELYWSI